MKSSVRLCVFTLLLLLAGAVPALAADLTGTIKDGTGAALSGASILVLSPQRAVVASAKTDQSGRYTVSGLPEGQYLVIVTYPGLAERQAAALVRDGKATLDLVLEVASRGEDVTVTASPGRLGDASRATQPINFISAEDVMMRAKTVVAQVVDGETGVHLQRTSPGMAGIFVRGLTGNKVNIFVDGVRYSNGAQRGGVNTFLDLIDPTTLEGVEVLRGTSSAQYGSDALGGSVQFLSRVPTLSFAGRPAFSGTVTMGAETAHYGGFGNVSAGYGTRRFGIVGSVAGRKTGEYRPGGGNDSHASVTRFFGLDSEPFYGERMADTGFTQQATQVRANWLASDNTLVVGNYIRSRQDGANRWDQILGGDGNLISELNDLQLDLAYLRVERLKAGWFDHASATYSFNTQREERVNQGGQGNPTATIGHEPERTTIHGVQFGVDKMLGATTSFLAGGDAYFEKLTSDAFDVNPVSGAVSPRRPRVPDQATYRQGGVFAQMTFALVPDRVSVVAAGRFGFNSYKARAEDAPVVGGRPLWPDDELDTTSGTFRVGAAFKASEELTFSAAVSTGYRAPHMTDLGTLGLTGSGFEVAAPDVAGLGGVVGTRADAQAVSTGRAVEQVTSETSVNYDFGARYRNSRARAELNFFVNNIDGNIQKQALILPAGAVGTSIGGQPITSQNANGVVFVALSSVPVLVRANFDDARIWGVEWTGELELMKNATLGSTFTYMRARDLDTDLPPNIEGGTPAPNGTVWFRWSKTGQNWWVQPYVNFAAEQSHLSTLDLGDRRTGATRTRGQIQNFFRQGARVRGWINPGADGVFGNGDDTLIETGETLAQIQDRVLGVGVNSLPLFTAVPSYAVFGVRFGIRFGPHSVLVDAENLGDENYRGISWGMDGPGRGISFRYAYRFGR